MDDTDLQIIFRRPKKIIQDRDAIIPYSSLGQLHSLKPTLDAPRKSAEIRNGNEKVFQPSIQVSGGVLLRVSERVHPWNLTAGT